MFSMVASKSLRSKNQLFWCDFGVGGMFRSVNLREFPGRDSELRV